MASLESNQPFDPRNFFHGQPCPRCQARRFDRRNFRNISSREGELVFILKCLCDKEMVLGLVYGPETDEAYMRRPAIFLVNHTKFHCPVCKQRPKAANWFSSGGSNRGYEMMTLNCKHCKQNSSVLVRIREIHDPLPEAWDEQDMPPPASEDGPVTTDYLLEFHGKYSDQDLWEAIAALPRPKRAMELPAQTQTSPEPQK